MTAEQFKIFWDLTYSETIPIPHYFKHDYSNRWFRIHSLPESKRYAGNETEWKILLDRQNQIITDLLGEGSNFLLVTGEYYFKEQKASHQNTKANSLKHIPFILLEDIDLHKISPDSYDEGQVFRPIFSEQIWQLNKFDDLLRAIADDEVEAFFVSVENNCIVAPYDGGIDFILKDPETIIFYKEKYKVWLSTRPDER